MKGQIQQVFIYILTIIVVGLILLIGYKAFGGIMAKGCDVEKATFKSNLNSYISKYTSYGSFHTESIKTPCSYEQVCFVSNEKIGENGFSYSSNLIIESSVTTGVKQNIFIVKNKVTDPFGYDKNIVVKSGVVCINNTNGNFKVAFEGLGKTVLISGVS